MVPLRWALMGGAMSVALVGAAWAEGSHLSTCPPGSLFTCQSVSVGTTAVFEDGFRTGTAVSVSLSGRAATPLTYAPVADPTTDGYTTALPPVSFFGKAGAPASDAFEAGSRGDRKGRGGRDGDDMAATPEPSTWLLLATGLAGMSGYLRLRRRKVPVS